MAEFPALPLWTDAYLGDTTHLTTIEHGAYLLLLFTAWRTPTYDLPDDDHMLARYCRMTDGQWSRIRPTIMAYWKLKNGRWFNGRLLDERDAVRRKVAQRSDAGKASALKRLNRNSTDAQRNSYEIPTSKATTTPIDTRSVSTDLVAPKRKSRKSIPEGFPGTADLAWAESHWLKFGRADLCDTVIEEVAKFRDHHAGRLTASADWSASWRTWARNAIKFSNGGHNGRKQSRTGLDNFIAAGDRAVDLVCGPEDRSAEGGTIINITPQIGRRLLQS